MHADAAAQHPIRVRSVGIAVVVSDVGRVGVRLLAATGLADRGVPQGCEAALDALRLRSAHVAGAILLPSALDPTLRPHDVFVDPVFARRPSHNHIGRTRVLSVHALILSVVILLSGGVTVGGVCGQLRCGRQRLVERRIGRTVSVVTGIILAHCVSLGSDAVADNVDK